MWKGQQRTVSDCNCDFFSTGVLPSRHEHKASTASNHNERSSNRNQEKKSVKKILIEASKSKEHAPAADKDRSKPLQAKKQPKRKEEKAIPISTKPSVQTVVAPMSSPRLPAKSPIHMLEQKPQVVRMAMPTKQITVKQVAPPKNIATKPPAVNKPVAVSSEYFIGVQFDQSTPGKKMSNQSTLRKPLDSLEITPDTMATDLIRQSSMNQLYRKEEQVVKKIPLRRSESEKQMYSTALRPDSDMPEDTILMKSVQRQEKARSLKNLVQYRNFQELRPKSTISSGQNKSECSQFSDVIQTFQFHRSPADKKQPVKSRVF